jgi:hypothetical protein
VRSWSQLTFSCGVELIADDAGITIVTGGGSMRLTNEQLSATIESVDEHLSQVGDGEVNVKSREWRLRYYVVP